LYCSNLQTFKDSTYPCRKCDGCQDWRKYQWIYRLSMEDTNSAKTWFCTCTFRKHPTPEILRNLWQQYMKRIRKTYPKGTFRYFCVQEKGTEKDRLHLHALLFCSVLVTKRNLEKKWKHGFMNPKLMRPRHIRYVSKYVTKGAQYRILASQKLGLKYIPIRQSDSDPHPLWYLNLVSNRTIQEPQTPKKDKKSYQYTNFASKKNSNNHP